MGIRGGCTGKAWYLAWAAGRWRKVWWFLGEVRRRYMDDNGPLMAAAISFYVLLSLVPLLLVGLSVLGQVLGNVRALEAVTQLLDGFLPPRFSGAVLISYLEKHVVQPARLAGVVGLVSWVWAGTASFVTIMNALDAVWGTAARRGFLEARAVAVVTMVAVGFLVVLSFGITSALQIIREYRLPVLGFRAGDIPLVWRLAGWLIPAALSVSIFLICYAVLPNLRIGFRPALLGALFAGMLWDVAKQGFALYIANFGNYSSVYGSLGGLVILVMWVYYSAVILLLGAEVAAIGMARLHGEARPGQGGRSR
ncbi:MAG: YihY/virulence factor BrkB family protein [Armatimonadota bacterium]|nr:YihY/virulence factor BrkB family protein [Armatimonadota bacterium]